jgi:DNA-directed RNA polymerase specialized sigma24 family protein
LVRYITNDIRRRGRERHKQQKMMRGTLLIVPPDGPSWGIGSFEEQVLLREYAREDERRWSETKKRAGITPFEEVVLEHDLSNLGLEGKLHTAKVAKATGLAVGTIKSHRSRYRNKLRRVI